MIRPEIGRLVELGPLPDSASAADDLPWLEEFQHNLERVTFPVSDEEAEALAGLFGPDDCFGLAWTLLHLIESAPSSLSADQLPEQDNEWIQLLRDRAERGE